MKKNIFILVLVFIAFPSFAQKRKVQNNQYSDLKLYHFGFHIGLHTQDLILTNNGIAAPNGEVWYAEIPNYSAGFSIGVIGDLFLNPYMNLRTSPAIHFGDKTVYFKEWTNKEKYEEVSLRANYVEIPLDLKISAMRLNNYRPYIVGGAYGMIDMGRKKGNPLLMKQIDYGLSIGLGCSIYMPYFKLSPELKFKFGLPDLLEKDRIDLSNEDDKIFTNSLSKATSRMIVLTFIFEGY